MRTMRDKIEVPASLFLRMADHVAPAYAVLTQELKPYLQIAKLPRYEFVGTRWFRASAGHTITKLRLYENGELVAEVTNTGYGDQYLQMGIDWLKTNRPGVLPGEPCGSTLYVRETLHADYTVTDVNREKDL